MFLSKDRQKFVRAVGILMILQGLVWFSLSIAAIIVKRAPPDRMQVEVTEYTRYSEFLSRIIFDGLMTDQNLRNVSKVIRPEDFEAFLWIYAILSGIWVAASLDQNFAIRYRKPRQSYVTLVLGVAILLTSIIDLVFVSLLARDFATCPFDLFSAVVPDDTTTTVSTTTSTPVTEPNPSTQDTTTATTVTIATGAATDITFPDSIDDGLRSLSQVLSQATGYTGIDCQVASGIVMSLAARGYVLWAINVVLGICLISIGAKAIRAPTLMTYGNNTIPRARLPEHRKTHSPNDMVFFGDNDVLPPPPPINNDSRNRNSTPVALNNKNQSIYF